MMTVTMASGDGEGRTSGNGAPVAAHGGSLLHRRELGHAEGKHEAMGRIGQ